MDGKIKEEIDSIEKDSPNREKMRPKSGLL
jgi:hypothetical protein